MHAVLWPCGRPHARVCSMVRARTDTVVPVWCGRSRRRGRPQRRGGGEQAQGAYLQADNRPRHPNASSAPRPSVPLGVFGNRIARIQDLFALAFASTLFHGKTFLLFVRFPFPSLFLYYLLQTHVVSPSRLYFSFFHNSLIMFPFSGLFRLPFYFYLIFQIWTRKCCA
jgi:hypothetical protein